MNEADNANEVSIKKILLQSTPSMILHHNQARNQYLANVTIMKRLLMMESASEDASCHKRHVVIGLALVFVLSAGAGCGAIWIDNSRCRPLDLPT